MPGKSRPCRLATASVWTADALRINDAGLDYRVAFARTVDGTEWVLSTCWALLRSGPRWRRMENAGGVHHPHLAERCATLAAAAPLAYGLFALRTREPQHRAAAAAQLVPKE